MVFVITIKGDGMTKIKSGASVVCKGCKLYKTADCVKWDFWENASAGYARYCLKAGGCISKKRLLPEVGE